MEKPSYEQGLQLHSNFLDLMRTVDHDEAQRLIQNFNLVHAVANGELVQPVPTFKVWKTITIGGMSEAELLKAVEKDEDEVSSWARDMMSKPGFTVVKKERSINLARATVGELGFTEMPTTRELWKRIREVGELCPAEVGPQLRRQYKDQPEGEVLWMAMEQITGSVGSPYVFGVGRRAGGRRWLYGHYAHPDDRWFLEHSLVFSPRK